MSEFETNRRRLAEDLLAAVSSMLPAGLSEEIRRNLDASIRAMLENLEIVTRSELEVQETALRRAREKLAQLEGRIGQLEADAEADSETIA